MSTVSQLIELYQEWGQASLFEREALKQENWKRVAECQSKKELLQEQISVCANTCSSEDRKSPRIKQILSDLISAQQENKKLLDKIREGAEQQRFILGGVARNLRRIQGSYGQQPLAVWQSYS